MAEKKTPSLTDRVTEWVEADPSMTVAADDTIVVDGDPPLTIEYTESDDRVVLTYRGGKMPEARLPGRGSRVRAKRADDGSLTISTAVYADGFSRQSFFDSVTALVAAVDEIGAPAMPSPSANAKANETPEATREMPATWVPTHAVPAGGTRAWAGPDPGPDPVATLEPRVRLSIAERRGDWARVIGSNGWTGWVDARVLEPLPVESSDAPVSARPTIPIKIRTLPGIAAVAIALSAFLPWAGVAKPADIPAQILWDQQRAASPLGSSFDLIWILIALAALAVVIALTRAPAPAAVLVGLASIGVAVLFAFQLYRAISDAGAGFTEFKDTIEFTPLLTLAGGVLLIAGASNTK